MTKPASAPPADALQASIDNAHDNYMRGNIDATTRDYLIDKAKLAASAQVREVEASDADAIGAIIFRDWDANERSEGGPTEYLRGRIRAFIADILAPAAEPAREVEPHKCANPYGPCFHPSHDDDEPAPGLVPVAQSDLVLLADDCRESAAMCNVDSAEGQHWVRLAVQLESIAADHARIVAELQAQLHDQRWQHAQELKRAEKAEASLAARRANEARYLWLRDVWGRQIAVVGTNECRFGVSTPTWRGAWADFDEAIDAAVKEPGNG